MVFDAYRVAGHPTEISDYHNIHVVVTKEAETADQFIEKFAHENGRGTALRWQPRMGWSRSSYGEPAVR